MKIRSLASLLLAAAFAGLLSQPLFAADAKKAPTEPAGKLVAASEADADWLAEARKSYPLTVCVASDEPLGSMGDSPEYIYRVEGKPDQLVIFCCDGCNKDFLKDPATHLAKIEAAKAAKAKQGAAKPAAKNHH